jgi:hypothetical protein
MRLAVAAGGHHLLGSGVAAKEENTMTDRVAKSRPGSRPTAPQGAIMIASVSGAAQAPTIITSGRHDQPHPLQ